MPISRITLKAVDIVCAVEASHNDVSTKFALFAFADRVTAVHAGAFVVYWLQIKIGSLVASEALSLVAG